MPESASQQWLVVSAMILVMVERRQKPSVHTQERLFARSLVAELRAIVAVATTILESLFRARIPVVSVDLARLPDTKQSSASAAVIFREPSPRYLRPQLPGCS